MVPEHPSQTRERPEPYEQTRAIPAWLAILAVVLALWGVVYLVLYAGSDWGIYGDRRSLAALEAPQTSAAGAAAMDGKALFLTHCSACHQATGLGIPGAFPPLAASGRVTGKPENLVKIMLLGVTGKLTVPRQHLHRSDASIRPTLRCRNRRHRELRTGQLRQYDGAVRRGTGGKGTRRTGWAHQAPGRR